MQLLEARVTVQLFEEGLQKWSSSGCGEEKNKKKQCSLSGILLGGLLHRKVGICVWFPSDWRHLRSMRKWHSLKQGTQPRKTEKSSWFQPRGLSEASTPATCTQLRSKYAKWSHAVLKVVQRRRIVWLARLDHNFSCVRLFFTPTPPWPLN